MFKKFNWGHGIALALASFVIFITLMILIFPHGQQNAEVVSDHYYEDELAYQDVINAKNNADKLAAKPSFSQDKQGITLTFPENIKPNDDKVQYLLFRTNDANLDVKKDLELSSFHSFTIPAKILAVGSYTLKLKWIKDKINYQVDYDVSWK
ncbi:FixH family protein [Halpernia frigidisoli]|uniref:FixH protein n=1 Tax=Halpernia frigidisoli TaxID=1125876 RepID=A0A1I3I2M9_9FLAO|nr:FixH family protein [Halpernia frigidisoli]SFI42278.1 FixH protein [Halpernia frigidisoli]